MKHDKPSSRRAASIHKRWFRVGLVLLFVAGLAAFLLLGGQRVLSLEFIREHRDTLLAFATRHYWEAIVAAVLIYTASTALSIPGGAVLSLSIGFLFGRWVGTSVILVGATAGAALVFLAARYIFGDVAKRRLGSVGQRIIDDFGNNALSYLLFLRLVPLFPFWLVNLAPAFTRIRALTYVLGTAVGILPGTFVYANLGQSLGNIDSVERLVSTETIVALALLGMLALVPVIARKLRRPAAVSAKASTHHDR